MAQLYENLRQLITVVDELRDVGLQNYISLPRIAAIGTQSSGKSSAIETVVGLDFLPRGGGVVTRRPLELRLVHLNSLDYQGDHAWATFDGSPDKFKDFDAVRREIEKRTDEVCGVNKGIVNDPIVMTIYSTSAPDLTVIDLPGVTRVPVKDSDQGDDIEALTREMTLQYIKDPRTIILAVLPANQDMSTSDALALARQVDPQGVRTIGVVTKIDIMDQGTDASRMLRGEEIPLRLGYVGVKMRSQQDIMEKKPIKKALAEEKEWFENHRIYSKLPPALVGTKTLIEKLTQVLLKQIRRFLPQIKGEINDRRQKVEVRIDELGQGVPLEDGERMQLLWTMITDYSDMVKNTIRGTYERKLQRYIAPGGSMVEGGGAKIRGLMNEFLSDFMDQTITASIEDKDIENAISMHQGDSLPGFPSPDTFEFLALPHLQKVISPSLDCVNSVSAALDHMAQKIAQVVLRRFPGLSQVTLEMTQNIIQREREATRSIVEQQVMCHTGYLFTNDNDYLSKHGSLQAMLSGSKNPEEETEEHKEIGRMEKTAQQIKDGSKATYDKVAGMVRGNQAGKKQFGYNDLFVKEMRNRLDSYFYVLIRNVRDLVPRVIGFYLVRAVVDKLQFELINSLTSRGSEGIGELLGEPPHISEERKSLNNQRRVLQNAHAVLTRDPTLAAIAFEAETEAEATVEDVERRTFEPLPRGERVQSEGATFGVRVSSGASAAAQGASTLLQRTAAAASSTAQAVSSGAVAALEKRTADAAVAVASNPAVQQQAFNAMAAAAANPAVQRQAVAGVAAAAGNPAVKQGVQQALTTGLGIRQNPLGDPKKKGFEEG